MSEASATIPDVEAETRIHGRANRSPLKALTLVLPIGYSIVFFLAPLIFLVILGFWTVENFRVVPAFSLANYIAIANNMLSGSKYAPLDEFPHLKAWRDRVGKRPAVVRGKALAAEMRKAMTDEERNILFGQRAR